MQVKQRFATYYRAAAARSESADEGDDALARDLP